MRLNKHLSPEINFPKKLNDITTIKILTKIFKLEMS